MSSSRSDLIDLALIVHHETEGAWLLSDTGQKSDAKWLPKSVGEREDGPGASIFTMPERYAIDRGWV